MAEENQLTTIAKESGLEPSKVENLLSKFADSFANAKQIAQESSSIVVTAEDQEEQMGLARTKRLQLKNIRVEVEHTRKQLKEQSLREGKAIDGMANIIKALIIPVEERLEEQEKFAEIKAAKQAALVRADRIERLSQYTAEVNRFNFESMSDDEFDKLINDLKKQEQAEIEAIKKAERERLVKEQAEAKEQERIKQENVQLKKDAEEREKKKAKETDRLLRLSKLGLRFDGEQYVKDDINVHLTEVRADSDVDFDAKLKAIEAELKSRAKVEEEKAEAERKRVKDLEAKEEAEKKAKYEEQEATRKRLLAPDKDKLIGLADTIDNLVMPNVADREAGKVLDETKDFLDRISKNLRKKATEL